MTDTEGWDGRSETTGTVAVIGMGKIGQSLAARYADAGWTVVGVDVAPVIVETLAMGHVPFDDEPGVAERIAAAHAEARFDATADHTSAASRSDVVIMIVPLMLTDDDRPDYRAIDAASEAVGRGLRPGTLVIYETTLPIGDTRRRFGPLLERASGLAVGDSKSGFLLAYSPERVSSGRVLSDLASYPKLVGGVDRASTERATAFYTSVLDAEVWSLSTAEAAEFAKLAETTYRNVNIGLANEFARVAEQAGVDILEVVRAANSQPYSHIHQPGLGVGGHCIPVYPHFLIHGRGDAERLEVVEAALRANEEQVGRAVTSIESVVGDLADRPVLVLGLTYRWGVREVANSRALALIHELRTRGALVQAYDPLLSGAEVKRLGASAYRWGAQSDAIAIITQTADPLWSGMDLGRFPKLELLFDGRNSLRDLAIPPNLTYIGVGLRGRADGETPDRGD